MAATAMLIAGSTAFAAPDASKVGGGGNPHAGGAKGAPAAADAAPSPAGKGAEVLKYKVKDVDGKDVDLAQYKGKVVMVVNVASKCGFTPQYTDLVEIRKKYASKGFEIIGFPANDFGHQEPGTNAEIKQFCSSKYNVDFPIMSKISVKDPDKAPIYKDLTSKEANGAFGGEIKWNFTKFLIGKDGKVAARFESKTKPTDPAVTGEIEKLLAAK